MTALNVLVDWVNAEPDRGFVLANADGNLRMHLFNRRVSLARTITETELIYTPFDVVMLNANEMIKAMK